MSEGHERRLPSQDKLIDNATKETVATIMEFREKMGRRTFEWLRQHPEGTSIPRDVVRDFLLASENEWHRFVYDLEGIDLETRKRLARELEDALG